MTDGPPVGLVLGSALAPEQIPRTAKLGEELGFCELWLAEDYFFTGGVSGATAALAATERVPIGLGIVSALVRHPALLAMEVSTVARIFPGRFWPGIGLGVPSWMEQMRLLPKSPVTAMRECVSSVRRLLDGEELSEEGRLFSFDRVRLTYPLTAERPPLYMGVIGPKLLRLSGEIADGTVLSVLASAAYVRWAREQIAAGMTSAGRSGHHRVAAFMFFSVDADGRKAKALVRSLMAFYLAAMPDNALTQVYGNRDELLDMATRGGAAVVERDMPDLWVDDLAIAGDPEECAEKLKRFLDAGADSVVLFPLPTERADEIIRLAAAEILPRLR